MAAPNEPPRRVSMAYVLGLSNKPFKDPKPPPKSRPRQSSGLDKILSKPIGIVEWAASDGRKGKLSGQGQSRSHGGKSRKVSSEKGGEDAKGSRDKGDKKDKAANDNVAEGENEHGFTNEEDVKLLAWKAENGSGPWATCAAEVGKPVHQCKERFKELSVKGGTEPASKEQGNKAGKVKGKGKGGIQQVDLSQMTNEEKAAFFKQKKEAGQANKQKHQKGNRKENDSGANDNRTDGDDPFGGGGFGMFGDEEDKKSKAGDTSDNKATEDAWGNGWGGTAETSGDNNAETQAWNAGGWEVAADTSGEKNTNPWEANNNSGGSNKATSNKAASNKGGNSWENPGGNTTETQYMAQGTSGPAWGENNDRQSKSGSKKGGFSNKGHDQWGGAANTSCQNGWDNAGENNNSTGFDATATGWGGGPGVTGSVQNDWAGGGSQKPASNNGAPDAWTTQVDGANDTANTGWGANDTANNNVSGGWDTSNNNANANVNFESAAWAVPPAPAKPASKANSHKSHHHHSSKERTNAPLELEVKPDGTFSADDLRLVARILQQDYQMVWNRVSWRFRDKTGRTVAPEVFEKKITGRVEGKGQK